MRRSVLGWRYLREPAGWRRDSMPHSGAGLQSTISPSWRNNMNLPVELVEEVYIPVERSLSVLQLANLMLEHKKLRQEGAAKRAVGKKSTGKRYKPSSQDLLDMVNGMRWQLGNTTDEDALRGLSLQWGMPKATSDKEKIEKWLNAIEKTTRKIGAE